MRRLLGVGLAVVAFGGCRQDMHDQPKYKPLRQSAFFADGRTSRPPVDGTIARGQLVTDTRRATGKTGGHYAANPLPRTEATYRRGRDRYDIYCSPCHDRVGTGRGMIVERGYKAPPSLHEDRLRAIADGYFVEVMAEGLGVMPNYAQQVPVDDRWAIAAWIRVLQRSQHATLADVAPDDRPTLEAAAAPHGAGHP